MRCYLDQYGFFEGQVNEEFLSPSFTKTLLDCAPPDQIAPSHFGWHWSGSSWVLTQDNRGRIWYNPSDPDVEFVGDAPDSAPPVGFVEFVNGQPKVAAPGLDLAKAKAAKNSAINTARLKANQSHFTFAGKQIAADPLSRSDIDAMHGAVLILGAMPGGWPGAWKAMDNSYVQIPDVATWGQFYGAMVSTGTAHFAHAQALKAQLAAATTPEEVAAVPNW